MLYVYGICQSDQPPKTGGLKGTTLQVIGDGRSGLCAIVSEHQEPPVAADPEDLWVHEAVVEAAMEEGAVLPMRVGSLSSDEAELVAALRARQGEFRRALQRVAGALELGIRAMLVPGQHARDTRSSTGTGYAGPGTAYMLSRLEHRRSGERLALNIHEPLAALARAATWQLGSGETPRLVAAYLVDRGRVQAFRERVGELAEKHETEIVCTGPWPPYSFASQDDR